MSRRTKWDILTARLEAARLVLERLEAQVNDLRILPCTVPHCGTCGEPFVTEKDFAAHYVVPDERFINLGHCPDKEED